ncbi:MAG: N-acetylmuramoyl-L-alanine amidase [Desulfocapsa sp.]|nr:N-acetylmuramoyl-L-alanine amidase [Desulfocapsa sp.]
MVRFFPTLFLLIIFSIPFSVGYSPAEESRSNSIDSATLEKQYQQAKFYYNELHTNTNLGQSRDNWLNGVRNFRKVYLADPKSEFAAPSLYMLGRMYAKMYNRFNTEIDLQESISYYRDVSDLFPDNRLADDALFAVGNIFLNQKNNPIKAAKSFTRIIADHRNGDMYPHASDKLKRLSQEHDIPLPSAMLKYSYLEDLSYVLPVKYWSSDNYTRVVIKASGPVTYEEILLEKKGTHPRRLYIDFQESYIEPRFRAPIPIEDGLLKQIRTAQFTPEVVRVVLDIESISDYKIFSLPDPFRVVIDVRGESEKSAAQPSKILPPLPPEVSSTEPTPRKSPPETPAPPQPLDTADEAIAEEFIVLEDFKKTIVNAPPPVTRETEELQREAPTFSLAQQLGLGVRKIVVDPGHGGKDPGASGFGLKEKDLVLEIAKKLAPVLEEQTGAQVTLTRTKDIFIPLEERTAIANTNGGDLFISLHINAHPSEKVHGLETYYLNLSTNAEAMRVAAFENSISTHQMSDLQDILSDIMKNSKIDESSRLAGFVHNSLCNGMEDTQKTHFKNLGVKQAPFYVLIGAEMPAILIEIAFITNPEESDRLNTDAFLDIIAGKIAEGVRRYISSTTASL